MSLRDGRQLANESVDSYLTSDISFAAFLILRGYELLGAVDTGAQRKEFGLVPSEALALTGIDVDTDIQAKWDEFENMYLSIPHDPDSQLNFRKYYQALRECHRSLDRAIRNRS